MLDINYYRDTFKGKQIDKDSFERLKMIAEDVIYDVCNKKPTDEEMLDERYIRALCYEIEILSEQGGIDAILGFAESVNGVTGESLGGYSVSGGGNSEGTILAKDGIPVSSLAVSQLRRLGLMKRWLYSGVSLNGKP